MGRLVTEAIWPLIEIGFGTLGITSIPLGVVVLLAAAWLAWHYRSKYIQANRGVSKPEEEEKSSPQPPAAREWTELDRLRFKSMWEDMLWHHGHVDRQGLREDILNDKPLNGRCWMCGEPRLSKGKGEDGEVHQDHN